MRKRFLAALVVPVFRDWGRVLSGVGRLGARPAFGCVLGKGRVPRWAVDKDEIAFVGLSLGGQTIANVKTCFKVSRFLFKDSSFCHQRIEIQLRKGANKL